MQIVFLGDIYDTFDPSSNITGFFSEQLRKIIDAKIPVIILIGNHDICSRHHALLPLLKLNLKNVKIIETPQILVVNDLVLLLFPYSVEIEKKIVTVKDQFSTFIADFKKKLAINTELIGKKVIFAGHYGVKDAMFNKTKTNIIMNRNTNDISLDDLDSIGAKFVFLGDYHKNQVLSTKKCISMYVGSIEKTDMSEILDKKGFVVYDSYVDKYEFMEYPDVRPMLDLIGDYSIINKSIDELTEKYMNAIVRITVVGTSQAIVEYDTMQQDIMKKLKSKIDPIYVKRRNKLLQDDSEKQNVEVERDMKEGRIETIEIIDVVKETIKERHLEDDITKELFDIADEIYKMAKENR